MASTDTQFKKGQRPSIKTEFIKGSSPWNKGKVGVQVSTRKGKKLAPLSKEHKEKIKAAAPKKENHPMWKGGINYNVKYRQDVLGILGLRCITCGFDDIRALQIDHVKGTGASERNRRNGEIGNPYKLILKKIIDGSEDYQVLCANCNWIKRSENGEGNKQHTI